MHTEGLKFRLHAEQQSFQRTAEHVKGLPNLLELFGSCCLVFSPAYQAIPGQLELGQALVQSLAAGAAGVAVWRLAAARMLPL